MVRLARLKGSKDLGRYGQTRQRLDLFTTLRENKLKCLARHYRQRNLSLNCPRCLTRTFCQKIANLYNNSSTLRRLEERRR